MISANEPMDATSFLHVASSLWSYWRGWKVSFYKRKSFSNSERRSGKGVKEVVIQIWVCLWQDASLQNTLCFWFRCISHCWAGRVFNQIAMVQNESAKFGDFDADKNRSCRMNHFRGTRYQACLHTSRVGCPYSIPQVLICVCINVLLYIHAYIYLSFYIYIYILYAFMPRQETYHGNLWLSRCLLYGSPPQMVRRKTPPFHQAIAKPRKRRFPWGKSLQSIKGKQKSPVPPLNAINTDQLVDEEFRDQSSIRKPLHLAWDDATGSEWAR